MLGSAFGIALQLLNFTGGIEGGHPIVRLLIYIISKESMKSLIFATLLIVICCAPLNVQAEGSGHEAGRDWAEEKGIDDPDDCGGKSQSFIEGCQEYAEEQQDENEEEDEE